MTRTAFLCILALGTGCMNLDRFLFSPTAAPANANLMAAATNIPSYLVQELPTQLVTSDNVTVNAYYLSHSTNDSTNEARHNKAILYCHGNTGNIDNYSLRAQALWQQGYNVLIFDYRSFGKTPGTASEAGVYADARAAHDYLTGTAGFGQGFIAFYGWSLGAAVCAEMAVEYQPPALILESPFASVSELITDSSSLTVPRPWFADAQFDNRGKIPQFQGDLLVMHGASDAYIMPKYGQEIATAAQGHAATVTFWKVPGASHDTVPCLDTTAAPLPHGGCAGGYSAAYFSYVTDLLDAALQ